VLPQSAVNFPRNNAGSLTHYRSARLCGITRSAITSGPRGMIAYAFSVGWDLCTYVEG
jgi:hypothetical protein